MEQNETVSRFNHVRVPQTDSQESYPIRCRKSRCNPETKRLRNKQDAFDANDR